MKDHRYLLHAGLLLLSGISLSCARVPKEVVELSYKMGEDMTAVHSSYLTVVHQYFEGLRRQRIAYVEQEWAPEFVRTWITDGLLVEVARGDTVWSTEQQDFVPPPAEGREMALVRTVGFWATAALNEIDAKKRSLTEPLDSQEDSLTVAINEAFNQLYRGNATITAHLNSLRKVQEVQDNALAALNVKDLRDKINSALIAASQRAEHELENVRKADGLVQGAERALHHTTPDTGETGP